jgi:hypothetical protein
MPNSGRITIISDFSPKELLDVADETASDSGCKMEDLDDGRKGFAIVSVKLDAPLYTVGTLARMATDTMRAKVELHLFADRTKKGDGRLTIDWFEANNPMQPRMVERFAESLADEIETRIEDDGGEIIASDSE